IGALESKISQSVSARRNAAAGVGSANGNDRRRLSPWRRTPTITAPLAPRSGGMLASLRAIVAGGAAGSVGVGGAPGLGAAAAGPGGAGAGDDDGDVAGAALAAGGGAGTVAGASTTGGVELRGGSLGVPGLASIGVTSST